jgi:hypothetical protein
MAVTTTALSKCALNLQVALESISNSAPSQLEEKLGMLSALRSSENDLGANRQVRAFDGKALPNGNAPKIEIVYDVPVCTESESNCIDICTFDPAASVQDRQSLTMTVDNCKSRGGRFSVQDFDTIAREPNEYLASQLRKEGRKIIEDINKDLIARGYAEMGNYFNGDDSIATPRTAKLISSTGVANYSGFVDIATEYNLQKVDGRPIVVGGTPLFQANYMKMYNGLGAQALGVNANAASPVNAYTDYSVDPVLQGIVGGAVTENHLLSWAPGALQFVEWFNYVGYNSWSKENSIRTLIEIDGFTFDYALYFDDKCGVWTWVLKKHYDLFCIPEQLYATCGDLFSHKLHWIAGCGDFSC